MSADRHAGWRSAIPGVPERRLAVRVTPAALRAVRSGHPWIFDASITSVSDGGAPGDMAVVFDDRRRFTAIGVYDPASPIRVKVLHHGRPAAIDARWWHDRIAAASGRRADLAAASGRGETTGYRVVHGENDALPALVVDRYDRTAVVKLYSAALIPHLPPIVDAVAAVVEPETIVLRLARSVQRQDTHGLGDGDALLGPAPRGPVMFRENGLSFEADVVRGQKTGHFLDQRDNRARVRELAAGARVLDVFSCTGGFAVHAAAGGARSVHCVDASAAAIATGERNLAHNADHPAVRACRHSADVGDAFTVMERLARSRARYDLVIVDPPSFAQKQADVGRALDAYRRLTVLALRLLAPGGTLVQASCSSRVSAPDFHAAVLSAANSAGLPLEVRARTGHPADHPVGFTEGAYLKAVVATRARR